MLNPFPVNEFCITGGMAYLWPVRVQSLSFKRVLPSVQWPICGQFMFNSFTLKEFVPLVQWPICGQFVFNPFTLKEFYRRCNGLFVASSCLIPFL